MRWVPLESSPDVYTSWSEALGLDTAAASFQDVYGLDAELLAMVPQPVHSLLVLFPITPDYERHRQEQRTQLEKDERAQQLSRDLVYFKQTIGNACGTMGLLHAMANSPAPVKPDSALAELFKQARALRTPAGRGALVEKDTKLEAAHAASASTGQTAAPSADASVDLHFCALVPHKGHVIELDGRKAIPVDHGSFGARDEDFLAKAAEVVRSAFIKFAGDSQSFNLIALCGTSA